MLDLDARAAAVAQKLYARASSGLDPTDERSDSSADAFESVFRRMKEFVASPGSDVGNPSALEPSRRSSGNSLPETESGSRLFTSARGRLHARDPAAGEQSARAAQSAAPNSSGGAVDVVRGYDPKPPGPAMDSTVPEQNGSRASAQVGAQSAVSAPGFLDQDTSAILFNGEMPNADKLAGIFAGASAQSVEAMDLDIATLFSAGVKTPFHVDPLSGRPLEMPGLTVNTATGIPAEMLLQPAVQAVPTEHIVTNVTAAGREQMLERIVQSVRMAHHNESTEVTVQLKPEFLGRLTIRVLADDHAMRVEIRAENEIVRQVLQDNMADLQQRLSEKGLAFDAFGVFAEAGSDSKNGAEQSPEARARGRPQAGPETVEVASAQSMPLESSRLIDCFA